MKETGREADDDQSLDTDCGSCAGRRLIDTRLGSQLASAGFAVASILSTVVGLVKLPQVNLYMCHHTVTPQINGLLNTFLFRRLFCVGNFVTVKELLLNVIIIIIINWYMV